MTEMMLKYHGCEAKKEEEEDNGFDCPECGKKYWSQKMLDIHKKVSENIEHMLIPVHDIQNIISETCHLTRFFRHISNSMTTMI